MDHPERKLDYASPKSGPRNWWDRLPTWAQVLVTIAMWVAILVGMTLVARLR